MRPAECVWARLLPPCKDPCVTSHTRNLPVSCRIDCFALVRVLPVDRPHDHSMLSACARRSDRHDLAWHRMFMRRLLNISTIGISHPRNTALNEAAACRESQEMYHHSQAGRCGTNDEGGAIGRLILYMELNCFDEAQCQLAQR